MSFHAIRLVYGDRTQKSGTRAVLLALAFHADDRGIGWPGLPLLAAETQLCVRQVRRCLLHLEKDAGLIEISRGQAPGGGWLFRIRLEKFDGRAAGTDDQTRATPVVARNDAGVTPLNIREPQEEQKSEGDSTGARLSSFDSASGAPLLENVTAFASANAISPALAEIWWNETVGRGWRDGRGLAIQCWEAALRAFALKWKANERPARATTTLPRTNQPFVTTANTNRPSSGSQGGKKNGF